jgi:hypothetical protein
VTGYTARGSGASGSHKRISTGYNFLPFLRGETKAGPREEYLYFGQGAAA